MYLSYRQLITQHFITKIACAKWQERRPNGETVLLGFMSKNYTVNEVQQIWDSGDIFKRIREHGVRLEKSKWKSIGALDEDLRPYKYTAT